MKEESNPGSKLLPCLLALASAASLAATTAIVQGPQIITAGEERVVASEDGVETAGDVDIDSTAQVLFVTDSDSIIRLKPGFEASPSGSGSFTATIEVDAGALLQLAALSDADGQPGADDVDSDGLPDWLESGLQNGDYGTSFNVAAATLDNLSGAPAGAGGGQTKLAVLKP